MKLGDKVRILALLDRRSVDGDRKIWKRIEQKEPIEGLYIGWRTLANGQIDYGYSDEPITFKPEEHFKAYLIVFNERQKPVFVLPEDVETLAVS